MSKENRLTIGALAGEAACRPPMLGSQIVLDLYECESDRLDDIAWVKATLVRAARAAGATIVQTVFHKFAPWGISGVVVISESHLAIHIWPEHRYAAVDVFTCGERVQMDVASSLLIRAFKSRRPLERRFTRGEEVCAPQNTNRTDASFGRRASRQSAVAA